MLPLHLVDGFNLMHAVILKGNDRAQWWRTAQQERVVEFVARCRTAEVWVVFDAASIDSERCSGNGTVPVFFASNADDYIVECCRELRRERKIFVVSADRSLVDRARRHGARGVSPWTFATLCTSSASQP